MSPSTEKLVGTLRGRVPRAELAALVAARFKLAWSRASVREDAFAQMRFLLERTRPDADLEAAARAYVRRQIWRGELRWHPEEITHQRVIGLDHLIAARDQGRGVVLSFMHHGHYEGACASLARRGVPLHMITYPHTLLPDAPGWVQQHVRVASLGGGVPVSADVGSKGITELLHQQKVVAIATDVPGRTPLRFVGRDVVGSFGAPRLAMSTASPVVVMTSERDDLGPLVRVHAPLDPVRHDSPMELLQGMLDIHEPVLVRWPELADVPLSRWGAPTAGDRP
jgi:lauroyl/myristoyl acyltransferase